MSNSNLISYKQISPNKTSPRNHKIDTITIHSMAGNLSLKTCGDIFAKPSRQASSNYGIDSEGNIGMYVEEADRSWCSSSPTNDHRAITIEVANDGGASTGWHISAKAYEALIQLLVDICRRNNIKQLLWKGDKNLIGQVSKQNMTVHRWFANKDCPGEYLYNLHGQIAKEVNALLAENPKTETTKQPYKVRVKASTLNVRFGAGTNFQVTTQVNKGEVYTIVDEIWNGSTLWGKLKSGAGWISLYYTERI